VAVKPPVGSSGNARTPAIAPPHRSQWRSGLYRRAAREEVATSRRSRGLSEVQLGALVGLDRSRISQIERGLGAGASLAVWVAVGRALERTLRLEMARDAREAPADAGHLAVQELLLRLARPTGRTRFVELATRPSNPARSSDVVSRDDRARVIILQEAWNSIGDIGAGLRSSARKAAEAEAAAVLAGGDDGPFRIASCWVVRATTRNRTLIARYPEVFSAAFPGSSSAWVRALTTAEAPPTEPGLVWCDVAGTRLFAWRRGAATSATRP
jgi:transcriptional regulator with XRE-family HTH domain